ncbi:hypothetical protein FRB95_006822 [Tulasnella sp. JGI-2019a]|nr:hypothetical protein FRB95_006822 [Tulasnella sp. JGI-2019a]
MESTEELLRTHATLTSRVRSFQRDHRRTLSDLPSPPQSLLALPLIPAPSPPLPNTPPRRPLSSGAQQSQRVVQPDIPASKRAKVARYANYVPEEETIRNDYSQRYVDTGEWSQNWILGAEPEKRFEEYPKQQRLLALKKAAVAEHALSPFHIPQSALSTILPQSSCKFDVILIDPPFSSSFTWDTLQSLPITPLAADPSFVFLWVGSGAGEGLEKGREVLAKWGYRRCEDIVWIKTNKLSNNGPGTDPPTTSLLTRTKQHCLMGIRGTVRRSTDSWFVHCNVDTDVIIWEGDPTDPTRKPPEMYTLIENFCLGARRVEVFGRAHSLRPGWVTIGDFDLTPDLIRETGAREWDSEVWESELGRDMLGRALVPVTQEIELLRPKSPNRGGGGVGGSGSGGAPGMMGPPMRTPGAAPQYQTHSRHNSGGAFSGGVGLGMQHPQPQHPHQQQMMAMQQNAMGGMMSNNFGFQNPNPHMVNQGMMMNHPMGGIPGMGMPMQMNMQYQQPHPQQMFSNEMFGTGMMAQGGGNGTGFGMDGMGGMQNPMHAGVMFNPMMGGGSMMGQNMGDQMNPGWNNQWDPNMQ